MPNDPSPVRVDPEQAFTLSGPRPSKLTISIVNRQ